MKKIIIAVVAVPVLFWMVWMSVPASSIQVIIEDAISGGPFGIEIRGLKKGFFYAVDIRTLTLKVRQNEFVSFDNIRGRINPLKVLLLKMDLYVRGNLGEGNVSGRVTFTRSRLQGDIHFFKINLGELAFLKRAGITGSGTVDGDFTLRDSSGHLEFITKDSRFEQADFSGVLVPLDFFQTVSGAIDVQENTILISSVSLEGKDMYAKLKGSVRDGIMDMTMEIMPGKSYAENPLVLAGLGPYKISPGYYRMPVKRELRDIF